MSGLEITYQIVGLKKLQAAVAGAPGLLASENAWALEASVEVVRNNYHAGMPEGPGHFGFHARDRVSTRTELRGIRSFGYISTDASQARWREFGTRAHDIAPRVAGVLAIGGGYATIAHHPGEKARHTMRSALRVAKPAILGFFVNSTARVVKSMATSGD